MKQNIFFKMAIFSTLAIGSVACNSANTDDKANADSTATTDNTSNTTMDNSLTGAEKSEGYQLLFDGKTTTGWRTYQNKSADSWSAKDGALYCKGD